MADATVSKTSATFTVTYSNPGDTISVATISGNNILVTVNNGFSHLAALVSAVPNADGSSVVATYRIDAPSGTWQPADSGTYTINMLANQVKDAHGNAVPAGNLGSFQVALLTVTINQASTQADPTNNPTINFTVLFSQAVSGFVPADVTLGGTASPTKVVVTGSGTTYNVAVSGMQSDGTITASIAAGVVQDSAGNPNGPSTSTDNTVTYKTFASRRQGQPGDGTNQSNEQFDHQLYRGFHQPGHRV